MSKVVLSAGRGENLRLGSGLSRVLAPEGRRTVAWGEALRTLGRPRKPRDFLAHFNIPNNVSAAATANAASLMCKSNSITLTDGLTQLRMLWNNA